MNEGPAAAMLLCGVLLFLPACADKTELSEREAMYHRYLDFASYVQGGLVEPHWMADGNRFWYAERGPDGTAIWKVDPVANTKRPLFDVDRLRRALATTLGHEPPHLGMPFDRFTFTNGEQAVRFVIDGSDFVLDLATYDVIRAPPPSEDELPRPERGGVFSPDGRWIATVRDHDLWVTSTEDGSETRLTSDGVPEYGWTPADWSPDGFTLSATKTDFRQAPEIPLVDWLGPNEEVEWALFPRRPGQPHWRTELFLIDVRSGNRHQVETGQEPDRRIFLLGWLPDGSHLAFFSLRDSSPSVDLVAAEPVTGATRVVLTEEEHPVGFRTVGPYPWETPFTALKDGRRFLWISKRTGLRHLYLYDISGHLVRPLTPGKFSVVRVVHVDERGGWVYFTALDDDVERPYDTHLYRASLEGEGVTQLTEAPGQHDVEFAPSGRYFLDTHSSINRPPAVELRRSDGELLRILETAAVEALKELKWRPPDEFVVRTADGATDLHGVLYKPFDFDPGKRYPVILYTLPPGRTFLGSGEREAGPVWPQAMAQLGFIVFRVDVRGGQFSRTAAGTIGRYEVLDYVTALKRLAAERPYMDLSRVGVHGLSRGGYHAIRAILQAPDIFHVGVAVNAITDAYGHPNFYVLGSPEDNRQAFEEASNLSLAGNLEGRLLLVHGTHDTSVPFSHAMKMVAALIREGKPYDLIVVPGWGHWYPDTKEWERYRLDAYRRYLVEHLQPD